MTTDHLKPTTYAFLPAWSWPLGLATSGLIAFVTVQFGLPVLWLGLAGFVSWLVLARGLASPLELVALVAVTLPIDRILSLDLAGTTVRLSQLAGLIGCVVILLQLATRRYHSAPFPIGWRFCGASRRRPAAAYVARRCLGSIQIPQLSSAWA